MDFLLLGDFPDVMETLLMNEVPTEGSFMSCSVPPEESWTDSLIDFLLKDAAIDARLTLKEAATLLIML